MYIFKTLTGSRLYGYHRANSDYDYRGVFLAPIDQILGLTRLQETQKQMITSTDHETSDNVFYELRKFCNLALKGNPNILEIIFAQQEHWRSVDPYWVPFYVDRHAFLSKQLYAPYHGFMVSEIKKLEKNYDQKGAANAWRLGIQAVQILETGTFNPTLEPIDAQTMRAIREGSIPQETMLTALRFTLETELPQALSHSKLPEKPNTNLVSQLCIETYRQRIHHDSN